MMDHDTLLGFLGLAEKLKCRTRHSWTSSGRHESVAEHVYRLMVFAWLVRDEFPDVDMNRVMELALFHDMGEAITGDIPAFEKTGEDERAEEQALEQIADLLPGPAGKAAGNFPGDQGEADAGSPACPCHGQAGGADPASMRRTLSTWLPWSTTCSSLREKETRDIPIWRRFGRG